VDWVVGVGVGAGAMVGVGPGAAAWAPRAAPVAAASVARTVTVPFISVWITQTNLKVPATGNDFCDLAPGARMPVSKDWPVAVAECSRSSLLTNVTVAPATTVTFPGLNARPAMRTVAVAGGAGWPAAAWPGPGVEVGPSDAADASATTIVPWKSASARSRSSRYGYVPTLLNVNVNDSPGSRLPESNSTGPDRDRIRYRLLDSFTQRTAVPGRIMRVFGVSDSRM
jgi:hypothetical protein